MKLYFSKTIAGFLLFFYCMESPGQTCCTGGAPLMGNFRIIPMNKGTLEFNIYNDFNLIKDFFQKSNRVDNDYYTRFTNTLILQSNFGLSNNTTISLLTPYLWLGEKAEVNGSVNTARTSGIGDFLVSISHRFPLTSTSSLFLSGAIKLPTGSTQKKSDNNILLQPTLQPGTGSFDYIVAGKYQTSLPFRQSMLFDQTLSYRINGTTNKFTFHDSYKFGNEIQSFTGISDQVQVYGTLHNPSIIIKYQYQEVYMIDGFEGLNTGGHWIYIVPGWQTVLSPKISVGVNGEWPVYRNVVGIQATTSYRLVG